MSQFSFGNIDETATDGYALANMLEEFEQAMQTGNAGTTAPTYALAGTLWRDTSASPHLIKQFDGSVWITVGEVNPTTHVYYPWANGQRVVTQISSHKAQEFSAAAAQFTPGGLVSLTLTETPVAPSSTGLRVYMDAARQSPISGYSYNPASGVISNLYVPKGTKFILAEWDTPIGISTVANGTVNWLSLATGTVATAAEAIAGTASKLISASVLGSYIANLYAAMTDVVSSVTGKIVTAVTLRSYVSPWKSYTPTVTGLGTVTGIAMFSRRVGDTLEIQGKITCGTPTAVEAQITLGYDGVNTPVGLTTDSTKLGTGVNLAGDIIETAATASTFYALVEPSVNYLTVGFQNSSTAALGKRNGSAAFPAGATIAIKAAVPITNW